MPTRLSKARCENSSAPWAPRSPNTTPAPSGPSPPQPCRPPPGMLPPGSDDKIMHATLRIGGSNLMLSDGHCDGKPVFNGFSLSLNAANEAEARRLFGALAEGGTVQMPLAKTFWSPSFGMLADRFGVGWMVSVPGM